MTTTGRQCPRISGTVMDTNWQIAGFFSASIQAASYTVSEPHRGQQDDRGGHTAPDATTARQGETMARIGVRLAMGWGRSQPAEHDVR